MARKALSRTVRDFVLVALGGAFGASARYGVALLMARSAFAFPWNTLIVNVLGGFAMGLLAGFAGENRPLQLALGVGVLGGFTTFSAFSLETMRMLNRGESTTAFAYVLASVCLSVGAAYAGFTLSRVTA